MNVGRVIKFIFYLFVAILVLISARVVYYKYFEQDDGQSAGVLRQYKLDFKDIKIPEIDEKTEQTCQFTYDFKNLLALLEAAEKVKYLDYLRFSRPHEVTSEHGVTLNQETLQVLVKAIHDEKAKLKKHIADLKSCTKDSIPSKRIKALKYYLRVIDLNLQDLKGVAVNKK